MIGDLVPHERPVLVTGATGFVGRHVLRLLRAEGTPVRALSRTPRPVGTADDEHLRWVTGDVTDPAGLAAAVRGCGVVIHCAAATGRWTRRASDFRAVNVQGVENLLRAAADAGAIRVVHVSTTGVYGRLARWPADEATPCRPNSLYRRSKRDGERCV